MINFFDLFAAIVTIGLAVWGFKEGILRSVIKLAGLIAALVLITVFSQAIVELALSVEQIPGKLSVPLFFMAIFALATILFHYLAELIHKVIAFSPVRFIDSGLGCLFGMLKSLLLNGVLALLLSLAPPGSFLNTQYAESHTAKTLNTLFVAAVPYVRSTIETLFNRYQNSPDAPEKKDNEPEEPQQII